MKNNMVALIIIAIVIAAAFFGGMKYQQSQLNTSQSGRQFGRFGSNNGNNRPVFGKIVSQDTNSITVQLQDGSSKIVNILNSTKISKSATASVTDLTTGQNVVVMGTSNSDGSVTAETVQLNPMSRMRGGSEGR